MVTAFDVVEAHLATLVVDISCNALNEDHGREITEALEGLDGVRVRKVSDRTFLLHLGGKLEVTPKVGLRTRDDLSRAYTPGVARVCQAIAANPDDARRLTIKRNTVAVVTDGSAVLGLGNLGAAAAMPVMEGKAALFKRFAGVDAWPVCLDTQDTEEIIRTVQILAPGYGGINLEDIAAPRCFEIERRLRELLDIPVFHDDQHGTAVVVLGALRNALRVVGKQMADCRIVVCGVGAAGTAVIRLLESAKPGDVLAVDVHGIVHPGRRGPRRQPRLGRRAHQRLGGTPARWPTRWSARTCSSGCRRRTCSARRSWPRWPTTRSSSRWRTPTRRSTRRSPRGTPRSSRPAGRTTRTRSTTCSRSPASSAACSTRTPATSPTRCCSRRRRRSRTRVEEPNASFIVPSVFDPAVAKAVAAAVRGAARVLTA